MPISSFWRWGVAASILASAVPLGVGSYASGRLRGQGLAAEYNELSAVARVAESHVPNLGDNSSVASWLSEVAASGATAELISPDGRLLDASAARSDVPPDDPGDYGSEPEFQQALSIGSGRAVRRDSGAKHDVVYFAIRLPLPGLNSAGENALKAGSAAVLRLSMPLDQTGVSISFERSMWAASFLLLLLTGGAGLLTTRIYSRRIRELKRFANRVAAGDFRPLEASGNDALDDLAAALNRMAVRLSGVIQNLTDEQNRSAAILRSMIEGVAVISPQERVIFSNRAFAQILSLGEFAIEGRPLVEVVRHSDLLEIIKKALAGAEELSSEIVIGTLRPRSFAVTAALVHTDGQAAAVLVLHEISELRRLERVRQDFVANISHEFRTPLTAIQGFAETLLGGALEDTANRARFVEIIRSHASRLARLTEDLLELSRIEAGQLELEYEPVSVGELIDSCLDTTRLKAAQRNLSLEVSVPDTLPKMRGDAHRLREVLQNLLDNAVHYTAAGGRLELSAWQNGEQVILTVADTGIGIPEAEQQRIFERFYRVDAARSREVGGTGLGLSIARHIVEAHGGRLWVESTVGEGSRFHFGIPAIF